MLTSRGSAAVPATGVGVTGGGPASQAAPTQAITSRTRARIGSGRRRGTDRVYGASLGTAGARLDTPHGAPHRSRTVAQRLPSFVTRTRLARPSPLDIRSLAMFGRQR